VFSDTHVVLGRASDTWRVYKFNTIDNSCIFHRDVTSDTAVAAISVINETLMLVAASEVVVLDLTKPAFESRVFSSKLPTSDADCSFAVDSRELEFFTVCTANVM
jgi:hypothetical protein